MIKEQLSAMVVSISYAGDLNNVYRSKHISMLWIRQCFRSYLTLISYLISEVR